MVPPDEPARSHAKRQNGADAAASPSQNELERIRSILFGESVRDLQGMLTRNANDAAERLAALQATIEQRHAALEASITAIRRTLHEHIDVVERQLQRRVDRGQLADLLRGLVDRIDEPGAVDHNDA